MYSMYCEDLRKKDETPVSCLQRLFLYQLQLFFFFKPKKDQCSTCAKYQNLNGVAKENFKQTKEEHIVRHREAQASKAKDKERAQNEEKFTSATFDLQSVLQLPSCANSLLYYSRKLSVYNLTVWEGKEPNNAHCFCWTEVDGKRGSCEIATCLYSWPHRLPNVIQEVSFFSDTCSGQNRNKNVLALLIYLVHTEKRFQIITQNFLESGHTFMEVDSMHSAIESESKYREIYSMTEWANVFRNARRSKKSYEVHMLDQKLLSDHIVKNCKKDEEGNTLNWLLIKSLEVRADTPKSFFYRYSYAEPFKQVVYDGSTQQSRKRKAGTHVIAEGVRVKKLTRKSSV